MYICILCDSEFERIHSTLPLLDAIIYLLRIYYETSLLFKLLNFALEQWGTFFLQFWLNFMHVNCVKSGTYITFMGLTFIQWVVVLCNLSTKSLQIMIHNDFGLCLIFPIWCMVRWNPHLYFFSIYSKKKCSELSYSPPSCALAHLVFSLDRGIAIVIIPASKSRLEKYF